MRPYSYLVPIGVLALCIAVAVGIVFTHDIENGEVPTDELLMHESYSRDAQLYSVDAIEDRAQTFDDYVYGGIVSHHLLASVDIAHFFHELSDQDVERVIIVGPNHFYPIAFPALTTLHGYHTPFGDVSVDTAYVERMLEQGIVQIDEDMIDTEHAISSLVPYVAAYLPDAEVVPIILTRTASDESVDAVAEFLKAHHSEKTVVIASVDFSHHLYSNASMLHDLRSVSAIHSFDLDSLAKLEIDSPQSIRVLLQYLEGVGAQDMTLWQQNAATIFDEYDSEDVTSYVFAHARKGGPESRTGVSALFFGDTMLGRKVGKEIAAHKDFFAGIRGPEGNFLRGYDAIAINLEGALASASCDEGDDELLIQPKYLSLLKKEGITHVGIANNHFQRCAEAAGVAEVAKSKLTPLGGTETVLIDGTGTSMAVVSVYAAPVPSDTTAIIEQVSTAARTYSHVVVNIHWGVEYDIEPTQAQRTLAHALIDAGAEIIIGHHPHVTQPVEVYKDGIIVYSLGNFISDQVGTATLRGLAAGVFFTDARNTLFLFPFEQINGIPTHISQEEARSVCAELHMGSIESQTHSCVIPFGR